MSDSSLSFGQQVKRNNKLATAAKASIRPAKRSHEASFPVDPDTQKKERKTIVKRTDKNMPQEVTSKKPVSRKMVPQLLENKPKQFRDPRFEALSGDLNEGLFKRSYGFIHDYQDSEVELIKKDLKSEKDLERVGELKMTLTSLQSRIQARKRKEGEQVAKSEWRKKEAGLVKEGKKPFFLKKCKGKPGSPV